MAPRTKTISQACTRSKTQAAAQLRKTLPRQAKTQAKTRIQAKKNPTSSKNSQGRTRGHGPTSSSSSSHMTSTLVYRTRLAARLDPHHAEVAKPTLTPRVPRASRVGSRRSTPSTLSTALDQLLGPSTSSAVQRTIEPQPEREPSIIWEEDEDNVIFRPPRPVRRRPPTTANVAVRVEAVPEPIQRDATARILDATTGFIRANHSAHMFTTITDTTLAILDGRLEDAETILRNARLSNQAAQQPDQETRPATIIIDADGSEVDFIGFRTNSQPQTRPQEHQRQQHAEPQSVEERQPRIATDPAEQPGQQAIMANLAYGPQPGVEPALNLPEHLRSLPPELQRTLMGETEDLRETEAQLLAAQQRVDAMRAHLETAVNQRRQELNGQSVQSYINERQRLQLEEAAAADAPNAEPQLNREMANMEIEDQIEVVPVQNAEPQLNREMANMDIEDIVEVRPQNEPQLNLVEQVLMRPIFDGGMRNDRHPTLDNPGNMRAGAAAPFLITSLRNQQLYVPPPPLVAQQMPPPFSNIVMNNAPPAPFDPTAALRQALDTVRNDALDEQIMEIQRRDQEARAIFFNALRNQQLYVPPPPLVAQQMPPPFSNIVMNNAPPAPFDPTAAMRQALDRVRNDALDEEIMEVQRRGDEARAIFFNGLFDASDDDEEAQQAYEDAAQYANLPKTRAYGECPVCTEENIIQPKSCVRCRNLVGCLPCVNRWNRRRGRNGNTSCPMCRFPWEGGQPAVVDTDELLAERIATGEDEAGAADAADAARAAAAPIIRPESPDVEYLGVRRAPDTAYDADAEQDFIDLIEIIEAD